MKLHFAVFLFVFTICAVGFGQVVYETEDLIIERITPHVYRHISFLETDSWGKVECNGMLVVNGTETIIFDTPTSNEATNTLIDWVTELMNSKVKAIVPTHFHEDCLNSLLEFHSRDIPSYANQRTIEITEKQKLEIPQHGFDTKLSLFVEDEEVILAYHGPGHTPDNIIAYYPAEEVIFGGCLVKADQASKGYLGDADTLQWSHTVESVLKAYPYVEHIIPGHGLHGGKELLTYTIQLFAIEAK